ncbi:hypothetical protein N0V82_004159 [Gnomoniopsis sp. IMI 355080]|nr:hypothetical protein N0V82_004159 [Gnomoniopsis sp. IMI 355080]
MSRLHLLWRITYHSLYYFLSLILLLLLCVTPADAIRQSIINEQRLHILTLIICLSVTLAAVVCIYFFRLYVMRSALASIPKPYIPIEQGDVRNSVRKVIAYGLSRSAAIAFESRPRVLPARPPTANTEGEGDGETKKARNKTLGIFPLKKATTPQEKMGITLPPHSAVWGEIEHNGWASPNSPDLPNLQYSTVLQELPNLIEAKALTLVPPPLESELGQPILYPDAIALLERQENMGLRQYLAHLAQLHILAASRTTADFLASYEYARYSTRPLSNARFRELMHLFAEILRTMQPLDPELLAGADDGSSMSTGSDDIDDDAPRESSPSTTRGGSIHRQRSNATSSSSNTSSQIRRPVPQVRHSSQGTWAGTYRTAPTSPKSRRVAVTPSPTSSVNSFAQSRPTYDVGAGISGSSSNVSLGSTGYSGSVIRLSEGADAGDLPYVLTLAETH